MLRHAFELFRDQVCTELPPNKRSQIDNLEELVNRRDELIAGDIDGKPREQVYKSVRTEMNKLNRSVLKVALDAGLIDSTANAIDRLNGRIQDILNNDKMSDAKKGRRYTMSEKHKKAISRSRIGHTVTEETREKIRIKRASQTVAPHSADAKHKISKKNSGTGNGMFGKKHSPEIIEKIREAGRLRHQRARAAKEKGEV